MPTTETKRSARAAKRESDLTPRPPSLRRKGERTAPLVVSEFSRHLSPVTFYASRL